MYKKCDKLYEIRPSGNSTDAYAQQFMNINDVTVEREELDILTGCYLRDRALRVAKHEENALKKQHDKLKAVP